MKKTLLVSCLLLSVVAEAQDFKVIGYLAYWNFSTYPDKIEWDRLTHLNLAFVNPDMDGNFHIEGADIGPVVQKAHENGVKVFASLAGGYLTPEWETAWNHWMLPGNLPVFVQKIKQFVQANQLDGVDIDLEWNHVNDLYSPFIIALKSSLDSIGLPLTAALPGSYRYPQITPQALGAFDWVNLMVYDLTGPWAPNNPGQHSPFFWAEDCLQYWQNQGLPGERQTLGVPFYGYDFGVSPVDGKYFREMVQLDPMNADLDQVGQIFYNGRPTIRQKTELALLETAGIMIWELGQDAYDQYKPFSLLKAIDEVVNPISADLEEMAYQVAIYPNPTERFLHVEGPPTLFSLLQISDLHGRVWMERQNEEAETFALDVAQLPSGIYFLKLIAGPGGSVTKFVKT